jgi:hypothetical protein
MQVLVDRAGQEAAAFVQMAFDVLSKDGEDAFRGFWGKVEQPQFASGVKSLSGAKGPPEVLAVVSPKTAQRQILVFVRYQGLPYNIQYVLAKEPGGLKIESIYETKELR